MWTKCPAKKEPKPSQDSGDLGRPTVPHCKRYMSFTPCSDGLCNPPRTKDEGLPRCSSLKPPISIETSVSPSAKDTGLPLSSKVVWVQSNGSGYSCRLVESDWISA